MIIWLTFVEILNKITKKGSYRARTFLLQSWVYYKRQFLQIPQQRSEAATWGLLGKKCILRNFAKFTGKGLCESLFFHKVAGLRPSIKFLRTQFLQNSPGRLLLKNNYHAFKKVFQIFLFFKFPFRKTGKSFIVSLVFVSVEE